MPREEVSYKHYYQDNAITTILIINIASDTAIITLNGILSFWSTICFFT
jgi:hypothetical protein